MRNNPFRFALWELREDERSPMMLGSILYKLKVLSPKMAQATADSYMHNKYEARRATLIRVSMRDQNKTTKHTWNQDRKSMYKAPISMKSYAKRIR